ncbi:hypothetical protein LCGC14_2776340, partial [marine sediment metagenome]
KYLEALIPDALERPRADRVDYQTDWGRCSIRAYSATSGDVVSGTYIAVILDEVSRWIDDRGRNPATEVIASITPGLISTGGKLWGISSPMGIDDAHAKAFSRGDGDGQMVAFAPTWVANAGMYSEELCHEMEPDELLYPPDLYEIAFEIVESMGKVDEATNNRNVHHGRYTLKEWVYLNDANNWFFMDSRLRGESLKWFDSVEAEFAFAEDLDTLIAKWRLYFVYGNGHLDWPWILGASVS